MAYIGMAYTVVEVPSRGLKSYGLIVMAYMDTAFTVVEVPSRGLNIYGLYSCRST